MNNDQYKYVPVTATGVVHAAPGSIAGIIVNSHTNGTLKLWDNASAGSGTPIHDTYTFPSGSSVVTFPKPLSFYNGVYATVGGTVNLTLVTKLNG